MAIKKKKSAGGGDSGYGSSIINTAVQAVKQ